MLPAHHPLMFGYYILARPTVEQYYDGGIIRGLPYRRSVAKIIHLQDRPFAVGRQQQDFQRLDNKFPSSTLISYKAPFFGGLLLLLQQQDARLKDFAKKKIGG